ncbi:MAG: hypothetical protein C4B59_07260 [Candidatus Methanogaster sp.]|uniref:Uncharacterized protein n=1 Tax=Candidatus Methanogaster sp. TaxID=3386292 RepID=A0AC61L3B0_9EURY|nr:MAG: hypothetical protein C4B59_07260 [ANME-2 cluster archaeon]
MLTKQSDISAVLMNKLCGEGGFIRVPEGAEYSAEDATNLLLHAATSCSKSFVARSSFFILQCIMHNCLNVLKQVVSITAYMLKSAICKGIRDSLYAVSDEVQTMVVHNYIPSLNTQHKV